MSIKYAISIERTTPHSLLTMNNTQQNLLFFFYRTQNTKHIRRKSRFSIHRPNISIGFFTHIFVLSNCEKPRTNTNGHLQLDGKTRIWHAANQRDDDWNQVKRRREKKKENPIILFYFNLLIVFLHSFSFTHLMRLKCMVVSVWQWQMVSPSDRGFWHLQSNWGNVG